jgi:hypothetical protein
LEKLACGRFSDRAFVPPAKGVTLPAAASGWL